MMTRDFLRQLLTFANSVQSDASQQCLICMSEYGTLVSQKSSRERIPTSNLLKGKNADYEVS